METRSYSIIKINTAQKTHFNLIKLIIETIHVEMNKLKQMLQKNHFINLYNIQ